MKPEIARWVKDAPKTVKVGAFDYSLKFYPDWLKNEQGENSWGLCDFGGRTLHIANLNGSPSLRDIAATIIHELLHAFWDAQFLGKKADEEAAVRAYEQTLVAFIRDNPKTMQWLLKAIV